MNDRKGFLLALILVFGFAAFMMLRPFTAYLLGAAILAFILRKPHKYLKKYAGERFSAFFLTLSTILLAIVPLILIGAAVADDARGVVQSINTTDVIDFEIIELQIEELTGTELDLQSRITSAVSAISSGAFGGLSKAINLAAGITLGLSLTLFLVYYLVKDGAALIQWIKDVSTLPENMEDKLVRELSFTTSAVLKGHLLVALAQGVIAGVGLAVFGIPNFLFWTFIMVLLGVIPIVGSMLIWLPAAVYLFISGSTAAAVGLLVYGFVIVGMTDNFLRPLVVDEEADLHPAVIIIGVLGGVTVFGAPGLFIGPISFGALKSVLTVFIEHYNEL